MSAPGTPGTRWGKPRKTTRTEIKGTVHTVGDGSRMSFAEIVIRGEGDRWMFEVACGSLSARSTYCYEDIGDAQATAEHMALSLLGRP